MSTEIETVDLIEAWLYDVLSHDDTLVGLVEGRVSNSLSSAPLKAPYVTFLMQSSRDVTGHSGDRISTDNLYIVKGVSQDGSYDEAREIAARISMLLHRPASRVSLTGGSLSCTREQIVEYPEVQDAIQYRHLGAIFRIRASADS
jgi:hypothetical protein